LHTIAAETGTTLVVDFGGKFRIDSHASDPWQLTLIQVCWTIRDC